MNRRTAADEAVLEWVQALQAGQDVESNSRRIFRRLYPKIWRFLAARCNDRARAEELAQDTFAHAFRQIEAFHHDGTVESWLFAIAANLLRNEWRRQSQQKRNAEELRLDDEKFRDFDIVEEGDSQEDEAIVKERLRAVMKTIEELPEKQQQCLRLYLAGHDYREIGELLGIAPSTARVHIHAARNRLKSQFPEIQKWLGKLA